MTKTAFVPLAEFQAETVPSSVEIRTVAGFGWVVPMRNCLVGLRIRPSGAAVPLVPAGGGTRIDLCATAPLPGPYMVNNPVPLSETKSMPPANTMPQGLTSRVSVWGTAACDWSSTKSVTL